MSIEGKGAHMTRSLCCLVIAVMLMSLICFKASRAKGVESPAPGSFEATEGVLDVRRSVMVMFALTNTMGWSPAQAVVFPHHRINPKAQKYARFFLENDARALDNYCPRMGALWILGFVGDDTSVPFVDHYIQAWLKSGVNDQRLMSRNLGHCMGVFGGAALKRDLPGARAFVEKYAQFNSWLRDKENPSPMALKNARRFCQPFVGAVFQFSKAAFMRPSLEQKIPGTDRRLVGEPYVKRLVSLPYDYYTELMKPHPAPTTGKYKGYFEARFAERANKIDALIAKADGKPAPKQPPATKKTRTPASTRSSRDRDTLPPSVLLKRGGSTSLYVVALCEEGVTAYEQFLNLLLSEDYDTLLKNILNNERRVYPEKVKKNRDGLVKDLLVERALMAEAQSSRLLDKSRYRNFQISVSLTANVERIGAEELETKSAKGVETVTLLFVIPESAIIYRKHIPQVGVGSAEKTITPEGDLQVYMKRINGKWYWNPFGW